MDWPRHAYHASMEVLTLKATLSPSRISDFSSCPLKFRYRNIDRIPERPGIEAFRGTVVHKVLEDLFDRPREQRTEEVAVADLQRAFEHLFNESEEARFAVDQELAWPDDDRPASTSAVDGFLAELPAYISRYFLVEQPETFDATHREKYVKGQLDDDLWLHGFVDRIDIAPTGQVRIVDYKTGKSPAAGFEDKALFQLKCYALLWEMEHDVPVYRLMMLFLGNAQRLIHHPQRTEIEQARDRVRSVWRSMKEANERATWAPKPSKLCDWCSFHTRCPAQGGTAPRFEPVEIELPKRR